MAENKLRELPSVHEVLERLSAAARGLPRELVTEEVRPLWRELLETLYRQHADAMATPLVAGSALRC